MRPHSLFRLLSVPFALAFLAGCAAPSRPRSPRVSVTVAAVERRAMPHVLDATGTIEPLQSTAVGSQVISECVELYFGSRIAVGGECFCVLFSPKKVFRIVVFEQQKLGLVKHLLKTIKD